MSPKVLAKHQNTNPKTAPEKPGSSSSDALEQTEGKRSSAVSPVHNDFRHYQNSVKTGASDISADIQAARESRLEKYR